MEEKGNHCFVVNGQVFRPMCFGGGQHLLQTFLFPEKKRNFFFFPYIFYGRMRGKSDRSNIFFFFQLLPEKRREGVKQGFFTTQFPLLSSGVSALVMDDFSSSSHLNFPHVTKGGIKGAF